MKISNIDFSDQPVFLAPMEDVTDMDFRLLCKQFGADMVYTEFVSSDALIRHVNKTKEKLTICDAERPVAIQIYGREVDAMVEAARICEEAQPDIIDINFGCPVKKVVCKGAGAAVLKDIDLMVRLTKSVVESTHLPVTVKTRLGWDHDSINIDEVAQRLQDTGIKALAIHGRTRAQMYKGHSDWSHIARVKANPNIEIPIFGNGVIDSPQKAVEYKEKYGVDGIMIGRAAIGYPWIFNQIKHYRETGELLAEPTIFERMEAAKNHLNWAIEWKGEKTGILETRMHYTNYFKGIPNFKPYRTKLVTQDNLDDLLQTFEEIEQEFIPTLEKI